VTSAAPPRAPRPDARRPAQAGEQSAEAAALWNGLVVEAALLELAAGKGCPPIRIALVQFFPPSPRRFHARSKNRAIRTRAARH